MSSPQKYNLKRVERQTKPTRSYTDFLRADQNTPPQHLFESGEYPETASQVAVERYTSPEFYEKERKMWSSVWQAACCESHVANPGDVYVYDICGQSFLIVRTEDGTIKAYPNACLHRGRRLRTSHGSVEELRCPFHGFTWTLEGKNCLVPCQWDFKDLDTSQLSLPEISVDVFASWVFINPDPEAMPLDEYLDPIKEHYEPYLWDQTFLAVHVGKVLNGNWKIVNEAFMESYHALYTHPQIMDMTNDMSCQYDVWPDKPFVSRMMVPFYCASAYVEDQVSENAIYKEVTGNPLPKRYKTARAALADDKRKEVEAMAGIDLSGASEAELIDGWYYNVFPNFMLWGGYSPNLFYRFRPWNDSHEQTLMEVGFIMRHPKGAEKPDPAPYHNLDVDEPWANIEALGILGGVLDQDTSNMAEVQLGLKTTYKDFLLLAESQESRIAQFHSTLSAFID